MNIETSQEITKNYRVPVSSSRQFMPLKDALRTLDNAPSDIQELLSFRSYSELDGKEFSVTERYYSPETHVSLEKTINDLRRRNPANISDFILGIMPLLIEKVKAMHKAGFTHNDLHAGNIMLDNTGKRNNHTIAFIDLETLRYNNKGYRKKTHNPKFHKLQPFITPEFSIDTMEKATASPLNDVYAVFVILFESFINDPAYFQEKHSLLSIKSKGQYFRKKRALIQNYMERIPEPLQELLVPVLINERFTAQELDKLKNLILEIKSSR